MKKSNFEDLEAEDNKNNIKTDLNRIGWECVQWILMVQYIGLRVALENTVKKFHILKGAVNFLTK
jgi:hypothetical protein